MKTLSQRKIRKLQRALTRLLKDVPQVTKADYDFIKSFGYDEGIKERKLNNPVMLSFVKHYRPIPPEIAISFPP